MNRLSLLLAEQSSPVEVIVFLFVVIAAFLITALLVYLLIMTVLRLGLPKPVSWSRVFFPSAEQFRESLGDYLLALATSVLLSLTLIVKHDLVQQISGTKVDPAHAAEIARIFDYGVPTDLLLEMEGAALSEVVQPLLAAGKVEESSLLVRHIVKGLPESWLTPPVLVWSCIALAMLYLLWLSRRRFKTLSRNAEAPPAYVSVFRSLLTLALCVGLLLASAVPLAAGGEKFLAKSALSSMAEAARLDQPVSPLSRRITNELRRQKDRAAFLYCPECRDPRQSVWEALDGGTPSVGDTSTAGGDLDQAISECRAACAADTRRLQQMMAELNRRLSRLEADSAGDEVSPAVDGEQLGQLAERLARAENTLEELAGRRLPGLARTHERDKALAEQARSDLDRRLRLVAAELAELGRLAGELESLPPRVTRLESFHQDRPSTNVPTRRDPACVEYAERAVQQHKMNLGSRCGFTGPRWSGDIDGHYNWCVAVPAFFREAETAARDEQLGSCREPIR